MAETIDELTIDWEEDGVLTCKEIDKVVLSKGAWTTILFRYQQWDKKKEAYGADLYRIQRYQKRNGEYQKKAKFNISSPAQARKIIEALQGWLD